MATTARRGRPAASRTTTAKRGTTTRKVAPKAVQHSATKFADNVPTEYHKEFARWLLKGGVRLKGDDDKATRQLVLTAFMRGVSLSVVAKNTFSGSPEADEWREREGITKRGPRPGTKRGSKVEDDEDDFEDSEDDEEFEEDDEDGTEDEDDSDEEFEDDDDESDDEDDSEDDEDDFEEEEAPKPAPRKRAAKTAAKPVAKRTVATRRRDPNGLQATSKTRAKKAAPKPASEDEFIF